MKFRPTEEHGDRKECACRTRARYGSLPRKDCAQCGGSGYVIIKNWKKDPERDEEP